MEFTLYYRGELKANGRPKEKQAIRRVFHQQLKELWTQVPLSKQRGMLEKVVDKSEGSIITPVNRFNFAPLVNCRLNLIAELGVTLLRPEPPGSIITQGGDIDNRLKTLFDALKVPAEATALPKNDAPREDEDPFFVLLEDDNLITKVSVDTDRLLDNVQKDSEVVLLIHVRAKATFLTWANINLA